MEELSGRLLNWASVLDEQTRLQAERTASMPFVHPHVALMPDAHLGTGDAKDLVEVRHTLRQLVDVKGA